MSIVHQHQHISGLHSVGEQLPLRWMGMQMDSFLHVLYTSCFGSFTLPKFLWTALIPLKWTLIHNLYAIYVYFRSELFVIWLTFSLSVFGIYFWLFSFELTQFNYSSGFEPTPLLENNIIHMISKGHINEDRENNEFILMEFSKCFSFRNGHFI